jgi:SAM-dependent methyltransferase
VLATEFSDYGRRAIEALGVRCVAEDIRALPRDVPEAPFDVVCLFQVLEHLDGLDALFRQLNALTHPAAHLFIAVPNDARVEFNEHHGSLLDLPPNHVGRWTRAAFDALAERHGWRVVAHEVEPEGAMSQVKQLVTYRYMRRRQDARSLANRVERIQSAPVRKVLQGATAAVYGLAALPVALELVRANGLGDSQWVHLQRSSE